MTRDALRTVTAVVAAVALVFTTLALTTPRVSAADDLEERANNAAVVLEELLGVPEEDVPQWLLERAHCVAVIPKVVKAGFIVAGRHGEGLLTCRTDADWSQPSFVSISGGSFGLQIGAQATDFVLVFTDREAVEHLSEDSFTLGGDASVSAGPVGRTAEAATDVELDSEIYSYSRSKGVFAGVSLEGAELSIDEEANREAYGDDAVASELLKKDGSGAPEFLSRFLSSVREYLPTANAER